VGGKTVCSDIIFYHHHNHSDRDYYYYYYDSGVDVGRAMDIVIIIMRSVVRSGDPE